MNRSRIAMDNFIKVIIFDLDDTLIDDYGNWVNSVTKISLHLMRRLKNTHGVTPDDIYQSYLSTSEELWNSYENILKPIGNPANIRKYVWNTSLEKLNIHLNELQLESLVSEFTSYREQINIDVKLKEVLVQLKQKYQLAICTNGTRETQTQKIKKAGLSGLFDAIICSDDVSVRKPDPIIYNYCIKLLGVRSDECLFVGDSWKYDIKGALAVGMRSIWISSIPAEFEMPPLVSRFSSIMDFLKSVITDEGNNERRPEI
ncbi:HAD family hydrolase [Paenibacillus xylanexedens]|uniref:HAD family hydrolase n=1 Tax=Paenibacillus xylanexedens TaxID=528191 RepID=UPI000F521AB3|nr:HAD family hydrolase [Paenibacillus xylanexedens]